MNLLTHSHIKALNCSFVGTGQVIAWKDLSPEWPIICRVGCKTLLTRSPNCSACWVRYILEWYYSSPNSAIPDLISLNCQSASAVWSYWNPRSSIDALNCRLFNQPVFRSDHNRPGSPKVPVEKVSGLFCGQGLNAFWCSVMSKHLLKTEFLVILLVPLQYSSMLFCPLCRYKLLIIVYSYCEVVCFQTNFHDKTPYSIMFGPDKCGNEHKVSVVTVFFIVVINDDIYWLPLVEIL